MSTDNVDFQLEIVTQQINRYAPIFLLLFGLVGNLLNCLVFTEQTLRTNPCSVYFLAARTDLTEIVSGLCQSFLFVLFSTRNIAVWMIAFATVDRYLISSPNIHRRQMSNLKNTYRCILLVSIISIAFWLAVFCCFDANMVGTSTFYQEKSSVQRAMENFLFNIFLLIAYIPNCISLFLYTLSGSLFRKIVIDFGKKVIRHMRC